MIYLQFSGNFVAFHVTVGYLKNFEKVIFKSVFKLNIVQLVK